MKYLKSYKLFEERIADIKQHFSNSKSYTKEDYHNLNELTQDVKNIMLDIIDEYQLTNITPDNDEHIDIDEIEFELEVTPNSYIVYNEVKYTRHGSYGVVTIKINCKRLYDEVEPSMGKEEGLFKDLISRLDTIGHSDVSFVEGGVVDLLRIEVIPRK